MKKFKYNLQRILTLKERREDLLKQELSRLIMKQKQHIGIKEHYEMLLAEEYDKTRKMTKFNAEEHEQRERYSFSIQTNIYSQGITIKDYDIKIDKKRVEIAENRKEIKTLEKLKERKLEEYNYELMLDERKLMDEISNRMSFVNS